MDISLDMDLKTTIVNPTWHFIDVNSPFFLTTLNNLFNYKVIYFLD